MPTPNPPQPGPAPQPPRPPGWHWPAALGRNADKLPTNGDRPYSPPKSGRGQPKWGTSRAGQKGWVDGDGNSWQWAPSGAQHGGPHWDVQHPDGSHTNVAPDGTVIGDDNFPNKRREPARPENGESGTPGEVAKSVVVGGSILGGLWLLGKIFSPLCGPAVVVCAVAG